MILNLDRPVPAVSRQATLWRYLVALLVFVGTVVATPHLQLSSNGDGWRIFRSTHTQLPADLYVARPFPRHMDFQPLNKLPPAELVPMSPAAALVEVISLTERALHFKQFDFLFISAAYVALYTAGLVLLTRRLRPLFLLPAAILLLNPYVIAYFNAPYEESIFVALIPLLCAILLDGARVALPGTRALVLLLAATKVQFAPILLLGLKGFKLKHNLLYLLLAMLIVGAVLVKTNKFFKDMNGYNRYFNGLAYSMAGVSSWPAKHFKDRADSGPTLAKNSDVHFPAGTEAVQQYWGTSYWPTGVANAPGTAALIARQQGGWYWRTVLANPTYLYRLASEPLLTAWRADYRMAYFFVTDLQHPLLRVAAALMRYFGLVYLVCVVTALILALRLKNLRNMLALLFFLLYPLLVVYGDGYYEFEKHLFPMLFMGAVYAVATLLEKNPPTLRSA